MLLESWVFGLVKSTVSPFGTTGGSLRTTYRDRHLKEKNDILFLSHQTSLSVSIAWASKGRENQSEIMGQREVRPWSSLSPPHGIAVIYGFLRGWEPSMESSWTWADLSIPYAGGFGGNARASNWEGIKRARRSLGPGEVPSQTPKEPSHMSATQRPISSISQEKARIQHWGGQLSLPSLLLLQALTPKPPTQEGKEEEWRRRPIPFPISQALATNAWAAVREKPKGSFKLGWTS